MKKYSDGHYVSKKNHNILKRNISIVLSILAAFSLFACTTNPDKDSTSTKHTPDSSQTAPSSTKDKAKKEEEAKRIAEEKKKAEEARKAEQEKKKAEEAKKAEEERLITEGENAVQNLESNQANENISTAQSAIDKLPDSPKKAELQQRVQAVQAAITQREEQARQEQEAQAAAELAAQQEQRTVYVARNGSADAYWYSMDNMPSNTRFDRVVSMSEAEAIASGKHPAKGHG